MATLAELCLVRAETHADAVALVDDTVTVTYRHLACRSLGIAGVLARRSVGPGRRVVLSGPNSVAWVAAAFGVLLAGGVVVPVNHRCSVEQRRGTVETARPVLVLGDEAEWGEFDVPTLALDTIAAPGANGGVAGTALPETTGDMTALVLQTSGTTGAAKFVPMRHGPLLDLYGALAPRIGLMSEDRVLGVVPLAHSFGLLGVLLNAMLAGATVRLVGGYHRARIVDLLLAEKLTAIFAPPTVFHDLAVHGDAGIGRHCRIALTGGSTVSLERFQAICDTLAIPRRFVGYGLTEAYGLVAFADVSDATSGPPALTPLPGLEVRVGAPSGSSGSGLPSDTEGEILVRGPSVPTEGLGGQQATDGWLRTGDLGRMNDTGEVQVISRLSETVIVSGFNVSPSEVEAVLRAHPDVADAVAFGVPDARRGERLVACVVTRYGRPLDSAGLREHCGNRLAAYQVPAELLEVASIPTTALGKPARAALRAAATGRIRSTDRNGRSRTEPGP